MMEPPAKRLRILQSVEVDEENEEYIDAKKAQEKRLKSRMESIFAKYENMHESNSDIIDMKANKLVVDRGHLRRLQRQVDRNETSILDTLGLSASKEEECPAKDDDENDDQVSEDELAPTQRPRATKAAVENRSAIVQPIQIPMPANTPQTPQQAPYTPSPAANLLQYVQFPQTPAGQQAQSAFYTTLTQTINQAVQQAVAPLFSGILSNTPSSLTPATHAQPSSYATPSICADTVVPATDPKWFFPPLPVEPPSVQPTDAAPLPQSGNFESSATTSKEVNETTFPAIRTIRPQQSEVQHPPSIVHEHETSTNAPPQHTPSRRSPRVEIQRRRDPAPKFAFSKADDVYISRKVAEKTSWSEIRDSRKKWRNWPLTTLQHHWSTISMRHDLHLQNASREDAHGIDQASPALTHHLPTPSSSRYGDHEDELTKTCNNLGSNHKASSLSHYDEDELELLSIAGDGRSDTPTISNDDELHEDVILPSIELSLEYTVEDAIQQDLLQKSPTVDPPSAVERNIPSATAKTKRQRSSFDQQKSIVPNSEAEAKDILEHKSAIVTSASHPIKPPKPQNARRSTSIDLVGDEDELLAPITPRIKRESSTPLPLSFLCTTPAPKPRAGLPSSDAKSTPKVSQKTFRKQIKQSWTKMGTPGPKSTGKSLVKRKSFPMLNRKRAWDGDESEDELAM
ncbi:hypothetical protein NX059_003734 [Plenodomus lindquistii]|nr:hypothetical protein NX059_003734 [Plenodomus lindquistii]